MVLMTNEGLELSRLAYDRYRLRGIAKNPESGKAIIWHRTYETIDEAIGAMPLSDDRDYVPYVTKYERRD